MSFHLLGQVFFSKTQFGTLKNPVDKFYLDLVLKP